MAIASRPDGYTLNDNTQTGAFLRFNNQKAKRITNPATTPIPTDEIIEASWATAIANPATAATIIIIQRILLGAFELVSNIPPLSNVGE